MVHWIVIVVGVAGSTWEGCLVCSLSAVSADGRVQCGSELRRVAFRLSPSTAWRDLRPDVIGREVLPCVYRVYVWQWCTRLRSCVRACAAAVCLVHWQVPVVGGVEGGT